MRNPADRWGHEEKAKKKSHVKQWGEMTAEEFLKQ